MRRLARRLACLALAITTLAAWTVSADTLHVWPDSPNPMPPYDSWGNAATNIQDAADAAADGDTVLVAGGVYSTGGRAVVGTMTNRVAIDKAITVASLMGPEVTVIEGAPAPGGGNGDGAVRCVYLGTNAVLNGFTLTNGHTRKNGDYDAEQGGGGAWCENSAIITSCIIAGNSAGQGGGRFRGTLNHCTFSGNSADIGGGTAWSTLYNCTLTDNSAVYGGGVYVATLYNCIIYFNSDGNYANDYTDTNFVSTFYYCCTTPLPPGGTNNITADPQLATLTHLSASSPCIGAGNSAYASGVDIDGEPWADPPCIGADQLTPGQATGALTMSIEAEYTSTVPGYTLSFGADNQGPVLSSVWDFGDGTLVTNQPLASHSWNVPGSYTVRLTGYNDSFSDGVTTTVQVEVTDNVYYVNQVNPTPVFPYTSWATSATNIQDAIEARRTVGGLVLVTNGVYASGTVETQGTNRIALTYPVEVRSVNGPEVTLIEGAPGIRCAYVGTEAVLNGFTLTNGHTAYSQAVVVTPSDKIKWSGGGAWCEDSAILTNCILAGNSASNFGGGAYHGTLCNCTLTANMAHLGGGGADGSKLYHCMVKGNSASHEPLVKPEA